QDGASEARARDRVAALGREVHAVGADGRIELAARLVAYESADVDDAHGLRARACDVGDQRVQAVDALRFGRRTVAGEGLAVDRRHLDVRRGQPDDARAG